MNMTDKVKNNESYRNVYTEKLNEMENQANAFKNLTKRINENSKKQKAAESKKKKAKDVLVTGATSKRDIRYLQRVLTKKINEVIAGEGDKKVKTIQVNNLQMKINELEKILKQIEAKELQEKQEKIDAKAREEKKKKKKVGSLRISGEELTINKDGKSNSNGTTAPSSSISLSTDMPISNSVSEILSIDTDVSVDVQL